MCCHRILSRGLLHDEEIPSEACTHYWPSVWRCWWSASYGEQKVLTHWGWGKMAAIFQMTCSNAFSWMKMYELQLKFHWSLFPRVQLTIFSFGSDNGLSPGRRWWLFYWRINASLGLNELNNQGIKQWISQQVSMDLSYTYTYLYIYIYIYIWVSSWRCGCLVTWFRYQLIAKPGNKTGTPPWLEP